MDFIGYDDDNDNLVQKLNINIGTRKYFGDFEEEIADDPFNSFRNPSQPEGDGFNFFGSLLKEESNSSLFNDVNQNLEQQQSFQNSKIFF